MRGWLAVALTLICTAVFGHGSEQWIKDGKLVDPVSKAFCCRPTDCRELAPGSVERVQGGYKVNTGWWTGYDPFLVAWFRALPFCISYQSESMIPKVQCFIVPRARYDRQGHISFAALIASRRLDVRFTPKSGHCVARLRCPLSAKSGHSLGRLFYFGGAYGSGVPGAIRLFMTPLRL